MAFHGHIERFSGESLLNVDASGHTGMEGAKCRRLTWKQSMLDATSITLKEWSHARITCSLPTKARCSKNVDKVFRLFDR